MGTAVSLVGCRGFERQRRQLPGFYLFGGIVLDTGIAVPPDFLVRMGLSFKRAETALTQRHKAFASAPATFASCSPFPLD
jgi:hypothetical protein